MSAPDREYERALREAFVERHATRVMVFSRRDEFGLSAIAWGADKGYLATELIRTDEQSSYVEGRLTDAGRKHFGVRA